MDEISEKDILEKVVKHPYITTTILAHSFSKNATAIDKLMEKFRSMNLTKYGRAGLPKSWLLTDTAIERYGFESSIERKPVGGQGNSQQGRNQGNNQRRSNNRRENNPRRRENNQSRRENNQSRRENNQSRRENNQSRRENNQSRRENNQSRRENNQSRRENNQGRGRQGQNSKSNSKQDEDAKEQDVEANNGEEQQKGSKKERQDKINELFKFFKEHSEHSFTAAEIAPEFGIRVPHLNSLLYELLGYGDVMKQFNDEEQQLVWYLADCHLESSNPVEH